MALNRLVSNLRPSPAAPMPRQRIAVLPSRAVDCGMENGSAKPPPDDKRLGNECTSPNAFGRTSGRGAVLGRNAFDESRATAIKPDARYMVEAPAGVNLAGTRRKPPANGKVQGWRA